MDLFDEDQFLKWMSVEFPQFKVSKSNLAFPTSDFVLTYYTTILEAIFQIENVEQIWDVSESQQQFINSYHPEAASFLQHVHSYNLYLTLKYIFSRLNPQSSNSDFSYTDVYSPERTPRRTCVYMYLMFNYYLFTVQMGMDLNPAAEEAREKMRQGKEYEKIKEELIAQLQEKEEKKLQYVEMLKDIRTSFTNYFNLNEEHQNSLKELDAKEAELQQELNKYESEEQLYQDQFIKLENEKKYLQSLVVSDENQVKEVHSKLLHKKEECVKKMKSLEDKVNITSSKTTQYNKVLELLQKLNTQLTDEKFPKDKQAKQMGFRHLHVTVKDLKDKITKLQDEESTVTEKLNEMEGIGPKLTAQSSEQESEHELLQCKESEKINMLIEQIDNQKKLYSQCVVKYKKEAEDVDEVTANINELSKMCGEVSQNIKDKDEDNKNKYSQFVSKINEIMSAITNNFE